MRRKRPLIGVIGSEIQSSEQQQILYGILEQAQLENADIAVFSNIYNPLELERADCCENRIYECVLSSDLNAVIMISESFVNEKLRENILQYLNQRTDIPIIIIGTAIAGFDFPCFNTSDVADLEAITDHLIEAHGFEDIALLTGSLTLDVSVQRLQGYRNALEKHNIPFDENKVIEGDFWYTSGEKFAKAIIAGEIPMPQALVCENDYMAFGVLDTFADHNINIVGKLAVIGYEFVAERNLHAPLLTTYQRNRDVLGKQAVKSLVNLLRGEPQSPFSPPAGRLIHGMTCPCDISLICQNEELTVERLQKQYADWNLKSDLERQLTECTDIDSFANAMGEHLFLLRGVCDCVLCLFEDWNRQDIASDTLLCRSVNPWTDHTVFRLHKTNFGGIAQRSDTPAAYYFLPLCFHDRLFGYCAVKYDHPERYDDICRNWVKSVSNGLEFLRLKADVRYLLQCRTLSASYDSMTGMFSAEGLMNAYRMMQNAPDSPSFHALLLRCCIGHDPLYSADSTENAVDQLLAAAKVLQQFQSRSICGRISEYEFLLILRTDSVQPALLLHMVNAELQRKLPLDSFLCAAQQFQCETGADICVDALKNTADQLENTLKQRRNLPNYLPLQALRNDVFRQPSVEHPVTEYAAALGFHTDYFNRKYKECFGQSFHQDCIYSRIMYAIHLLLHTALNISETAERCGYTESKYFIRQFSAVTGCPPKTFRDKVGSFFES